MRLNARRVSNERSHTTILLGMEDITDRRILEREKDVFVRERINYCNKRICFLRNCSTAFPIVYKSSRASSC